MKTLQEIRKELNGKILSMRSIERFSYSEKFQNIFENQSDEDKDLLMKALLNGDKETVKTFLKKDLKKGLSPPYFTMTMRELREVARRLGIYRYSNYSKSLLISEIMKNEKTISHKHPENSLVGCLRSEKTGTDGDHH